MASPVSFLPFSPGGTRLGLVGMRSTPGAVEVTTSSETRIPPAENSTSPVDDSRPPSHSVADPWGSRSTTMTRRPRSAKAEARLTVVVVLPLPPLLLDSVTMRISAIALDSPNEVIEEVVRDRGDARRCPQQEAGRGRLLRRAPHCGSRAIAEMRTLSLIH